MTRHNPFGLPPAQAVQAEEAAIQQIRENARAEGFDVPEQEIRAALNAGSDWWESIEIARELVERYRPR